MKKIYKFNEAEGVFLPCFNSLLFDVNEFSAENCNVWQYWDCVKFEGTKQKFSVTWEGMVNTSHYDTIQFYITVPTYMKMSAAAVIDGEEVSLFSGVCGENGGPIEPSGRIPENSVVEKLVMNFDAGDTQLSLHTVGMSWIGFVDSKKLADALKFPKYDSSMWADYINYDVTPDCRSNVFFTEVELDKIRRQMQEDGNKNVASILYQSAEQVEGFEPEKSIGKYMPVANYRYVRVRDRGRELLAPKILPLAVGGYLFQKPEWTNLAARIIICMTKIPHWYDGPQCDMEGSTWHHVCFEEINCVREIVNALGFLGGKFTQKALEEIKNAVYIHYQTIVKCANEQGYRKFSNQSMIEEAARMFGACGLYHLGMENILCDIEECYREHTNIINQYINEEFHCSEGPGYYQFSMSQSIYLWKAYSKFKKLPLAEVIPKRAPDSLKYLDCVVSTIGEDGYPLYFSDTSSHELDEMLVTVFSNEFDWQAGKKFLANRKRHTKQQGRLNILAKLFMMGYDSGQCVSEAVCKEKYCIFEKSGLASYEKNGSKFWFLAERNPCTGHYHNDRGSILLEFQGETILTDPGVGDYSNWRLPYMQKQEYHNLSHPEKIPMKLQSEIAFVSTNEAGIGCRTVVSAEDFLHPQVTVNYIKPIENGIAFSANLEEIYPGVTQGKREGVYRDFGETAEFELCDEWKIPEAMPVWVNFNAYHSWEIQDASASVCFNRVKLTLNFSSEAAFTLSEDASMTDGVGTSLYTLHLKTKSGNSHKITTKGVITPL